MSASLTAPTTAAANSPRSRGCSPPGARGDPAALGLLDDAAVLSGARIPGWDLVITTDALVEGVHFLPDDPLDLVARKLLRVNLSDLAAKGAAPFGYYLLTAPPGRPGLRRRREACSPMALALRMARPMASSCWAATRWPRRGR